MLLLLASLAAAALPADAQVALRRGDCRTAMPILEPLDGLDAAVARARCGSPEGLESHLDPSSPLDPYARLLLARALLETDPAKVESLLQGVSLDGELGLELRLIRGRALIQQERSLEARDDLRALLNTSARSEALYWLAYGAEQRGDDFAAADAYRTMWTQEVASPFSALAGERLQGLGYTVPDYETEAGRELVLTRARNLAKEKRPEEAAPLFQALDPHMDGARWDRELAMALFKARDYPASMEAMGRLDPTQPGVVGGAETLFHYALGTSRNGDYEKAAEYYTALFTQYPSTKRADTASFKLGYLRFDAGDLQAGIPLFEAHLQRYPSSAHADEAMWFIGWSHYQLGQLDPAKAAFDKLLTRTPKSSLAPAALYWKARILGRKGDVQGEEEALSSLIDRYPTSGHAWFAAERLGRTFQGIGEVTVPPLPQDFIDQTPAARDGLALLEAGQVDWARARLLEGTSAAKAKGRSVALSYAHLLIEAGAYREAKSLSSPWCPGVTRAANDPLAASACTPRPEHDVVQEAAAKAGLNPNLPYAIMTAESALQPQVSSWAGARGLMQLMPSLGDELHAELQEGIPYDPDRLFIAGYNAWLGTTELGRLDTRFRDAGISPALPLTIAGYNGGAEAVARWVETAESPDGDWFAENIGYTETRRYCRRVLGFLMMYRWVYGDDPT